MVLSEAATLKVPLVGQVLALEDSRGKRLLLVSLDLIGISSALCMAMQVRLGAVAGVSPEAVVINVSHTHSGPMTHFDEFATLLSKPRNLVEYEVWLVDQMALAAGEAVGRLASATVDCYLGRCDIGINRRRFGPDGKVGMGPNPEGVYRPELFLLDLVQSESGARCLAFSVACHPVIEVGWAPTLVSPDFPGEARAALKERFGEALHTQFFQAACGNIRPRILADLGQGVFRRCESGDAEKVGRELAQAVEETLQTPPERLKLELAVAETWAVLPKEMTVAYTREDLEAFVEQKGARGEAARYWLECHPKAHSFAETVPWPVGIFSLTPNCRIAWFGGEPFAEWQELVRQTLGDERVIIWGYTGKCAGYLPLDENLPEGGYEVSGTGLFRKTGPRPLGPGINAAIAEAFRRLDERLRCGV